jgi:hypothetical protein
VRGSKTRGDTNEFGPVAGGDVLSGTPYGFVGFALLFQVSVEALLDHVTTAEDLLFYDEHVGGTTYRRARACRSCRWRVFSFDGESGDTLREHAELYTHRPVA